MKKLALLLAVVVGATVLLTVGPVALAGKQKHKVKADDGLSGYAEVPAISTVGFGSFEATLGDTEVTYELTYSDLEGAPTQAHIHFGQRSVSGGTSVFLCANPPIVAPAGTQACPSSPATVTGTITAASVVGPAGQGIAPTEFAEFIAAVRAGQTYVDVHSSKFTNGEIRGQINDSNQHDDD